MGIRPYSGRKALLLLYRQKSNMPLSYELINRRYRQVSDTSFTLKKNIMKKRIPEIICGLLILLFAYAAFSKLLEFGKFRSVLSEAPLISNYAALLAAVIPAVELIIVLLLIIPETQKSGLATATGLLIVFTGYLVFMVFTDPHLPCSCSGVIQQLSWKQHIVFNAFFIGLRITGIYFEQKLLPVNCSIPKMMHWQHLNEMVSSGLCELGIHSKSHARFSQLTYDEKAREILDCKESIYKNTGMISNYFAFPYGSEGDIGDWCDMKKILDGSGIQLAFTTEPGELNVQSNKFFISRVFINDSANMYTLKSRINGTYQRGILKKTHFKWDI